jgi:hypothetical protein
MLIREIKKGIRGNRLLRDGRLRVLINYINLKLLLKRYENVVVEQ